VMAVAVIGASRFLGDVSVIVRVIALVSTGAVVYAAVLFFTMPKSYRSMCRGLVARFV
jgi:hypothetical protein